MQKDASRIIENILTVRALPDLCIHEPVPSCVMSPGKCTFVCQHHPGMHVYAPGVKRLGRHASVQLVITWQLMA